MAEDKQLPPDSKLAGRSAPAKQVSPPLEADPLRRLFDAAESENDLGGMVPGAEANDELARAAGRVGASPDDPQALRETVFTLTAELRRLKVGDRVLAEMHERCRKLSERFHEREVIGPVFLGLIGIADRCRGQAQKIKQTLRRVGEHGNEHAKDALRYLADARTADRVELESLLALHGVEPYEHPGDVFKPAVQKPIGRAPCKNTALIGRVASRVLPGYERHGKVIRAEYVTVYVHEGSSKNKGEGTC